MSAPLLQWVGGKGKLAPEILPLLTPTLALPDAGYCEPFAGGAAVYFALREAGYAGPALLADANAALIGMYRTVLSEPGLVIGALREAAGQRRAGSLGYYGLRDLLNDELRHNAAGPTAAACFLLVNRLGFNGLWRVNKRGLCNVPAGTAAPSASWDETVELIVNRIEETRDAIGLAYWTNLDWHKTLLRFEGWEGPVAFYVDPPYLNTFTGYTPGKFGLAETQGLIDALEGLRLMSGSVIVLSNSVDAEPLLGNGWEVRYVTRSGTVNSDPTKRGRVTEILAVRRF